MTALIVLGGMVVVFGGGATAWSWAKSHPNAPEWMRRNRKAGA